MAAGIAGEGELARYGGVYRLAGLVPVELYGRRAEPRLRTADKSLCWANSSPSAPRGLSGGFLIDAVMPVAVEKASWGASGRTSERIAVRWSCSRTKPARAMNVPPAARPGARSCRWHRFTIVKRAPQAEEPKRSLEDVLLAWWSCSFCRANWTRCVHVVIASPGQVSERVG